MGLVNNILSEYSLDIRQMMLFVGCINKSFNHKLMSEIKELYSGRQINIFAYKLTHQFVITKAEKFKLKPIENDHFYGFEYFEREFHIVVTNEKLGWTKKVCTNVYHKFLLSLDDDKLRYYRDGILTWTSSSSTIPTKDEIEFIEGITGIKSSQLLI